MHPSLTPDVPWYPLWDLHHQKVDQPAISASDVFSAAPHTSFLGALPLRQLISSPLFNLLPLLERKISRPSATPLLPIN